MSEIEHGTRAGYQAEKKAGTTPCARCKKANTEYSRTRRAAEKTEPARARPDSSAQVEGMPAAVIPEPAPAREPTAIPDDAIRFMSLAQEGIGRWAVSAGYVEREGASPTIVAEETIGLPVGDRLIERLLELLKEHGAQVLLVGRGDAVLLGRFDPGFSSRLSPAKAAVVDEPTSWDPASNRARHLAASSAPMIAYTARVRETRQELERELAGEGPKHKVVGAVVDRGKMFENDNRFIQKDPVYEELPQGHPALTRESYVGGSDPRAERRARRRRP